MRILVTNDDGVASPGLKVLAKALEKLGEVYVVAPDRERTAVGHALTLHKPLRIHRLQPRTYAVNGTPTDCVNLGIKKILLGEPDLLVSGINKGVNVGDDVTYSGTVSAALEGTILGISSIAVSQEGAETFRFSVSAAYAVKVAKAVLKYGLPEETFVNVNVPDRPRRLIKGVKVTTLGKRRFENPIVEKTDPQGRRYYWIAGTRISWERAAHSDHEALKRGMVSISPLHLDMTNHTALPHLQAWVQDLNPRRRMRP